MRRVKGSEVIMLDLVTYIHPMRRKWLVEGIVLVQNSTDYLKMTVSRHQTKLGTRVTNHEDTHSKQHTKHKLPSKVSYSNTGEHGMKMTYFFRGS